MAEYKNKVVFLRKSSKGNHLYAFSVDENMGGEVGLVVMNIAEVQAVIDGSAKWAKISLIPPKEDE